MAFEEVSAAPAKAGKSAKSTAPDLEASVPEKTPNDQIVKIDLAKDEDPTAKLDAAITGSNDLADAVALAEAVLADPANDANPVMDELIKIEPAHHLIHDALALAQQYEDEGNPDNASAMHIMANQLGDLHRTILNLEQQTNCPAREFLAHSSKWF